MTYTTDTHVTGTTFGARFATFRVNMADARAKRATYRTTLAELTALSNRDLDDLGISRSMIRGIASEAAYGK